MGTPYITALATALLVYLALAPARGAGNR